MQVTSLCLYSNLVVFFFRLLSYDESLIKLGLQKAVFSCPGFILCVLSVMLHEHCITGGAEILPNAARILFYSLTAEIFLLPRGKFGLYVSSDRRCFLHGHRNLIQSVRFSY